MDQRISLITLGVADLERSKAFYEKLGWVPADGPPGILFYQLPGAIFSLYPIAELEKEFEGKLDEFEGVRKTKALLEMAGSKVS